ncbi:MAG TPA: FHA domain-containing protein [bacterium]|nr:FHA domain-containing protein [bacterium]
MAKDLQFTQPGMPALAGTIHCPQCKLTGPPTADHFCPHCGWWLDQPPPGAQGLGPKEPITDVVVTLQLSTAERFTVKETPFLIGRDQGDLRFPDDLQLSRLHAALIYKGHQLYVRDLDSRNGTFLDDRRLPPNEEIPVAEGEVLRIGNKAFEIRFKGDEGRLDAYGQAYFLEDPSGRRFPLRPGENLIGRGEHAHIRVPDNDAISRVHAKLNLSEDFGRFRIELQDLKSENGTLLNGDRVLPQRWVTLEVGDVITLADQVLTLGVERRS